MKGVRDQPGTVSLPTRLTPPLFLPSGHGHKPGRANLHRILIPFEFKLPAAEAD
jgi:hypothetical protein